MRRLMIGSVGIIVLIAVASMSSANLVAVRSPQVPPTVKPEALAGAYKGTATNPDGATVDVNVTLKYENGAFSGTVEGSGVPPVAITGGTLTGDRLVLNVDMGGNPGTITGTLRDSTRFEGTYAIGDMSGSVTFTKAPAAPAKPAADKPAASPGATDAKPVAAAANDPITGQWDGVSGNSEMSVPFTMRLKLDGDKVSGDISSEQGGGPLSAGTWKDGALTLSFDLPGMGTVTMVGAIQEGKLSGSLDVGGQMQMQWAAVRKSS